MSPLRQGLDQLRAWSGAPFQSYLTTPIRAEHELTPLREAAARQVARAHPFPAVRPSTLRLAMAKWAEGSGRLEGFTSREVRALCWAADVATTPTFVRALADLDVLDKRRSWIVSLIAQYFALWRQMPEPTDLEALLVSAVGRFAGRSARIEQCRAESSRLFSAESAQWFAAQIVSTNQEPEQVFSAWDIPSSSGLGRAVSNAAVLEWASRIRQAGATLSAHVALAAFDYFDAVLLRSEFVGAPEASKAMSAIVLSPVMDTAPALVDRVQSFVLSSSRFGDPRLPANRANWALCAPAVTQKVASWFSKQDLNFFFQVALPNRLDPHGRRRFWERYLPQLIDCVVLLSPDDDRRLRAQVQGKLHYGLTLGQTDVSAFIMRFRGASELIIIEFSRPNNAIYVHDADQFETATGGLRSRRRFSVDDHLKRRMKKTDTFSHTSNWQERMADFLRRHNIRRA